MVDSLSIRSLVDSSDASAGVISGLAAGLEGEWLL
jgi:hypothetical protein